MQIRFFFVALPFFVFSTLTSCNKSADSSKQQQMVGFQPGPDTVKVEQANAEFDSFGFRTDTLHVSDHKVKRNESFYLILDRYNFTAQEIYNITRIARDVANVRYLRPGQFYRTYATADSVGASVTRLVWQPNPVDYVVFDLKDTLRVYASSKTVETRETSASATIETSLYETMQDKELSPVLASKLSEVYAWEIDFYRLRRGDKFNVVYEKNYIDGEEYGVGSILAAEFEHMGKTYRAYKFDNEEINGYFDENGNSMQKALLKVPFRYNQRISSRFSRNRFHPILKRRRAHNGIDYAAPYGTPVLAVGDGQITEARYRGANGNIVKIRHNSNYGSAYLHLKGFARGIKSGVKVEQGQVIGYVGKTGRVTGTHLHYEVYKNGRAVNPLTLDLPASESVPEFAMEEFEQVRDAYDLKLKEILEKDDRALQPLQPMITDINNDLPAAGKNSSEVLHTTHWYEAQWYQSSF